MKCLFDQEEVMEMYVRDERKEAARKKESEMALETAARMIRDGEMSLEKIAYYLPSLSIDKLKKLEEEIMRPV